MSHTRTIVTGLADYAVAHGLGQKSTSGDYPVTLAPDEPPPIGYSYLPPSPDRFVAITPYGAHGDQPLITLGSQPVQLRFRGNPDAPGDPDDMADAWFDVFHGLSDVWFGDVHVVQILRESSAPLGMDEQSRRWMRSDNYYLDVDLPATALRIA